MKQLKIIPLIVHGALGYLLGVWLIVAPFVLELEGGSSEMTVSVLLGVLTLLVTLVSKSPVAAAPLVPLVVLEGIDYVLALILVVLPFVMGLADDGQATGTYVGTGLAFFVVTLLTRFPRKLSESAGMRSVTPEPVAPPAAEHDPASNGAAPADTDETSS